MRFWHYLTVCFITVSSGPLSALPRVPVAQVAKTNNEFALAFYKEIIKGSTNMIYSPYGLSSAMAIAYLGAKNETQTQIAKYFYYPVPPTYLAESFRRFNENLISDNSLGLANSLWVQENLKIKDDFLDRVGGYFEDRFHELDFEMRIDSSRNEINKWVASATKKKIPSLLNVSELPRNCRMLLVAVTTIQAPWERAFALQKTKGEKFFVSSLVQNTVPMMSIENDFPYTEDDDVKVVEIPFFRDPLQEARLGFWVVMPKSVDGLKRLETNLSANQFNQWIASAVVKRVSIRLPRFKINQITEFREPLEKIGLTLPFSDKADFTGMTEASNTYICKIYQKNFFSVSEKGCDPKIFPPPPEDNVEPPEGDILDFRVDRPFMFFIYDNNLNQIIFMGRCLQP